MRSVTDSVSLRIDWLSIFSHGYGRSWSINSWIVRFVQNCAPRVQLVLSCMWELSLSIEYQHYDCAFTFERPSQSWSYLLFAVSFFCPPKVKHLLMEGRSTRICSDVPSTMGLRNLKWTVNARTIKDLSGVVSFHGTSLCLARSVTVLNVDGVGNENDRERILWREVGPKKTEKFPFHNSFILSRGWTIN